jgi:hypothetical protein
LDSQGQAHGRAVRAYSSVIAADLAAREKARIIASDRADNDLFGYSAAVYGNLALVGAQYGGSGDSGAAYLFDITNPSNPVQKYKLTASDATPNDNFGCGLSLYGNYALVGASGNSSNIGAAYLFDVSDPTNPVQKSKLTAIGGSSGDLFGSSVYLKGTYAVIGARGYDSGKGIAYLFDVSDPINPVEKSSLVAADGVSGDSFGYSVALDGSLALASAPYDDNAKGTDAGAAYLFDISTPTAPIERAKIIPSDGAAGDTFGWCVGLDNSVALITAQDNDGNGANSGAAYIFDVSVPTSPDQKAKIDGAAAGARFGQSCVLSGNKALIVGYKVP